jgi:5'-deoxy-5'-methylthioadenosine phosphorylase
MSTGGTWKKFGPWKAIMTEPKKTLALVGGTGLNQFSGQVNDLPVETPYGTPSADIQEIAHEAVRLLFLPRHGSPHRYPPHCVNYRANMWALKEAGADHVLAVSAVGGISPGCGPGSLVLVDQLVDYTWGREHTYCDSAEVELMHVDFTRPYDGHLRDALLAASRLSGVTVRDGGCIGVFQGPRLESAAEIRRAQRDGCDLAGMTSLPEAGLARELGLDYAGLAVVSNWGAGVTDGTISEDDIAATLKEPMVRVRTLVEHLTELL